jgi:hypothetical protein
LSVWVLSQAATSASTACPNSVLAPLRKTSVSGSENVPGWVVCHERVVTNIGGAQLYER